MTRAIVISGNALRFHRAAERMRSYLLRELDINPLDIRFLRSCETESSAVLAAIEQGMRESRSPHPLLLHFAGAGHEHGWFLDDARSIPYGTVAQAIWANRSRKVLVVNDCDQAMLLAAALEEACFPACLGSVIGAAETDERADGPVTDLLIRNWSKGKPHRLGPTLHWGDGLDHHFYAPRRES